MDDRPPRLWWDMWKRFLIAGALIVGLSAAATATLALNTLSEVAKEVFQYRIKPPPGLVTPVYSGGPQTFLILGSDRRRKAKSAFDRNNPPHSDTMLLVRFDPGQGQTSVMSIPRDLLVDIKAPGGLYYSKEKVNSAYTIGSKHGGVRGGMVLAAETIKSQVFPGLKLNGIVDVNFAGFINVVDKLGCVYVNVDHRYYHVNVAGGEAYSEINLQPGYQKLCYESALSYVRYRHGDSDFVRAARQQDFMRDLREQISPGDVLGQIHTVAKAVGRAIVSTFSNSGSELKVLAKLVAFSQGKPLRQVKFRALNVNAQLKGGSYVTTTPALAQATLRDFMRSSPKASLAHSSSVLRAARRARHGSRSSSAAAFGLYPASPTAPASFVKATVKLPLPVLLPTLETGSAVQQAARVYYVRDQHGRLRHAYAIVWQHNSLGAYYDLQGTDWPDPPVIAHPDQTRHIGGRTYMLSTDGGHIHTIAWRQGHALYWLTNTLLEDLTNQQMLGIARSVQPMH
jgi:LCP family protein required for cell wall assembly